MKKALLILSFILLVGCVTKREVYLMVISEDKAYVESKQKKDTICLNRFEKQFHQADSVFMSKLSEASRVAVEKTNKQVYLK